MMGRSSKPKRSEKMAKKGLTFYIYKHPLSTGGPTSDATAPIPHTWDHPMPSTSIVFFIQVRDDGIMVYVAFGYSFD